MTADDVFRAHYEARGGVEKLGKVKGVKTLGEMAAGPMALEMEQAYMAGGAGYMRISAGGNVMQETRFDGEKGSESAMGQNQPMDDDDILEAKRNHDLLEFLHLGDYGVTAELLGIDRIEDVPHYLIEIRKDGAVGPLVQRGDPHADAHRPDEHTAWRHVDDLGLRRHDGGQGPSIRVLRDHEDRWPGNDHDHPEVKLNPKLDAADYSVE